VARDPTGVALDVTRLAHDAARMPRLDRCVDATTMRPAPAPDAMDLTSTPPAPHATRPRIDPAHAARAVSPEVQRAIAACLRAGGVAPRDVADVAQDVTLELLVARVVPADMPGCLALARDIAAKRAIDVLRKHKRRGRYDTGATDGADDHAAGDDAAGDADAALDRARQLALIDEKRADGTLGDKAARMLQLDAEGLSAPEIARDLGLAPQTVRNTLSAVKRDLRAEWMRRVGSWGGGALLLLVVLGLAAQEPGGVTAPFPGEPAPSGEAPAPEPSQERAATAAELRSRAIEECRTWALPACERDLDEARALDPAGESAPAVQAARRAVREQWPMGADGPPPARR
jgi:DNA-directed RNA polymerase specialized sigma24 family protein